jgi:hypothetical protein
MARIRTIKPEFPQSESMGRVSRDARLLFVELWTICDDAGRTRAASRMLASLLFPYDDDAPALIDGWLGELEAEGCIVRYAIDGTTYLQIAKWLSHQKIDKPSPSRFPQFEESSRIVAKPRECSSEDLGPRTVDLGMDQDLGIAPTALVAEATRLPACPTTELIELYHKHLPTLPRVRVLNDKTRIKHLTARWREVVSDDEIAKSADPRAAALEWFAWYFHRAGSSDFLTGKEKGWRASFDFLINPSSFAKVIEGNYHKEAA